MSRNRLIVVLKTEDGQPISPNEIREIEKLFTEMLFDAWCQSKGALTPPPSVGVRSMK